MPPIAYDLQPNWHPLLVFLRYRRIARLCKVSCCDCCSNPRYHTKSLVSYEQVEGTANCLQLLGLNDWSMVLYSAAWVCKAIRNREVSRDRTCDCILSWLYAWLCIDSNVSTPYIVQGVEGHYKHSYQTNWFQILQGFKSILKIRPAQLTNPFRFQ